jgi:hypothetical protein
MLRRGHPDHDKRQYYADKGISVCERWLDLNNFIADMGLRPEGKTIDRIDNAKGYEPGNCRWATNKEQMQNTSNNVFIDFNGKRKCAAQWALETGIQRQTILKRFHRGWPAHKVLSTRLFHEQKGAWGHTHASRGKNARSAA